MYLPKIICRISIGYSSFQQWYDCKRIKISFDEGVHMTCQKDMSCIKFSNLLNTMASTKMNTKSLRDPYKYSAMYDQQVHQSQNTHGKTQKQLMVPWFINNSTLGSEPFSRKEPNYSAKRCFGNLKNAASLLWIAETVGICKSKVAEAFEDAKKERDCRRACGAIRHIITWSMIMQVVHNKTV